MMTPARYATAMRRIERQGGETFPMDDIEAKVLISTKDFLERLVASGTLEGDTLTEAHMAVTALGYQVARGHYDPAALDVVKAEESELARKVGTLLHVSQPAASTRTWQEIWNTGVGAKLTGMIEASDLEQGMQDVPDATQNQIAKDLRDFLVSYHEPMDPVISAGTGSTYQGGRGDVHKEEAEDKIYITAPTLERYLRDRFPEHAETRVINVKRLMGGYSKETYIIQLEQNGEPHRIVIRKDGYGLPTGSSVASEYNVFQEVYDLGLPVPRPLWLETDHRHFSASYMAVDFRPGIAAHLNVPKDDATRALWVRNLAEVLAKLHTATAQPNADIRAVISADLDDLQRRIDDRERAPHPGIAFGMAWLRSHLDLLKGRPACRIHGDVGFHNILMDGNEILALLDWEYSHLSDPIEDLVYVKPFLDQIDGWDDFLPAYEAASGFSFEAKAARYFRVWKEVRNTVACLGSLNSLLLPQVKDVALSVAGTIYIPKYEIAILDAIIGE